jgi:hypothetical protein
MNGLEHAWLWSVLPAHCGEIEVRADPALAAVLAAAGRAVAVDQPSRNGSPDVTILRGRRAARASELRARAAQLREGQLLVLAPRPKPVNIDRWGRWRLFANRLGIVPAVTAAWAARACRRGGAAVWVLDTGPRTRSYDIRAGRRPHPGRHPIVVAGTRIARGLADEVVDVLSRTRSERLAISRRVALTSGVLMLELAGGENRSYVLRLASGRGAELLVHADDVKRRLLCAGAPRAVAGRLAPALEQGELAGVRYTLEPRLPGSHPGRLDAGLMAQCVEFLASLSATANDSCAGIPDTVERDVATLADHLDSGSLNVLHEVRSTLSSRLSEIPPVWTHGDFWLGNLLVANRRLAGVLDWDAATPAGLPLADVLHLIALGDRRIRRLAHGPRCTERLWPLARAGGDRRLREACLATGTPSDAATLTALAVGYWLSRVARDVRTFPDRLARPDWMAVNVVRPLGQLGLAGL